MYIKTSEQEVLQLGIGNYSCNWGTHICGLYGSEAERDEIVFGYLKQGFMARDKQIYIHSEQSEEDFCQKYNTYCPDCRAKSEDAKLLEIKTAKDMYFPTGVFDPWYMDTAVNDYYAYTQKDDQCNLRAIAEMAWALEAIPGVEYLFAYESRLNYFVKDRTVISICLYNVKKISGTMMMNVLQTHPFTINGGVITKNPYYIHPDKWLAENAPQFL